jgi:predicted glycoside hydrolase/deacetylase ChbG (UPF0249 family)
MKQVILNGDDFGWSKGVVDGIVRAYDLGVLRSTSIMTTMPAYEYGLNRLSACPEMGVGVHLTIFDGCPLLPQSEVPSLVDPDTGQFIRYEKVKQEKLKISSQELYREFKAQILELKSQGIQPTHLDNHCDLVYMRPAWLNVVIELAKEFELPLRCPFGNNLKKELPQLQKISGQSPLLIRAAGTMIRRKIDKNRIARTQNFISDYFINNQGIEGMEHVFANLPEGTTEILSHPGYGEEWRQKVQDVLEHQRFRELLLEHEIQICSYHTL